MKCLSVSQPFADLVVSGRKSIDLRGRNTGFRGEFLVHAPLKVRHQDARRLGLGPSFVTGAIVGRAELVDVKRYESAAELHRDYRLHLASREFGDRRYGFVLRYAKKFSTPIPYKGKLGFFEVDLYGPKPSDAAIIADIIDEEYRYQWINRH